MRDNRQNVGHNHPINYQLIASAVEHYRKHGYRYIEVPWLVSEDSLRATKPDGCRSFETFAGNLVASGEQSFIELFPAGTLGLKTVCVTPCFRDERPGKPQKPHHFLNFMKVELIHLITDQEDYVEIFQIMHHATTFFEKLGLPLKIEVTDIGYDIMSRGVELGSYGVRECTDSSGLIRYRWVYGTGLAEPRTSCILNSERCEFFDRPSA